MYIEIHVCIHAYVYTGGNFNKTYAIAHAYIIHVESPAELEQPIIRTYINDNNYIYIYKHTCMYNTCGESCGA